MTASQRLLFWTVLILVWGAVGLYVSFKLGWPERYGIRCGGRCYPNELIGSAVLVRGGSPAELLMFVWLWSWPAVVIFRLTYWLVGKLQEHSR